MDKTIQTSETQLSNVEIRLNHNIVEDSANQIEIDTWASIGSSRLISRRRETDITRAASCTTT